MYAYTFDVALIDDGTYRVTIKAPDYPHAEAAMLAHVGPAHIDRAGLWTVVASTDPTITVEVTE